MKRAENLGNDQCLALGSLRWLNEANDIKEGNEWMRTIALVDGVGVAKVAKVVSG